MDLCIRATGLTWILEQTRYLTTSGPVISFCHEVRLEHHRQPCNGQLSTEPHHPDCTAAHYDRVDALHCQRNRRVGFKLFWNLNWQEVNQGWCYNLPCHLSPPFHPRYNYDERCRKCSSGWETGLLCCSWCYPAARRSPPLESPLIIFEQSIIFSHKWQAFSLVFHGYTGRVCCRRFLYIGWPYCSSLSYMAYKRLGEEMAIVDASYELK